MNGGVVPTICPEQRFDVVSEGSVLWARKFCDWKLHDVRVEESFAGEKYFDLPSLVD